MRLPCTVKKLKKFAARKTSASSRFGDLVRQCGDGAAGHGQAHGVVQDGHAEAPCGHATTLASDAPVTVVTWPRARRVPGRRPSSRPASGCACSAARRSWPCRRTAGAPWTSASSGSATCATRSSSPPIDHHYVSFTVRGPLHVERDLGGGAGARQTSGAGVSLIMGAGQTNCWRWDQPTTELQLFLRPSFLEETAAEAGLRRADADRPLRLRGSGSCATPREALLDELRAPRRRRRPVRRRRGAVSSPCSLLRRHCTSSRLGDEPARGLTPRQLRRVGRARRRAARRRPDAGRPGGRRAA